MIRWPDGMESGFSKRSKTFRAIESVLRGNSILRAVVKSWQSWEGKSTDVLPPSPDRCPWVMMSAIGKPNDKITENSYKFNFSIQVDVAVAGTLQEDSLDLWEVIEGAIQMGAHYGGDPRSPSLIATDQAASRIITVQEYMTGIFGPSRGVKEIVASRPAMWTDVRRSDDATSYMQRATGALDCYLQFP